MKYVLILDIHGHVYYEEFDDLASLEAKVRMVLERERENYPHFRFSPIIYRAERVSGGSR